MNYDELRQLFLHDPVEIHFRNDRWVLEVNTKEARWRGKKFKDLSTHEKRKFENFLFLKAPQDRLVFIYT